MVPGVSMGKLRAVDFVPSAWRVCPLSNAIDALCRK